jgi:hypothetical protein
VGCGCVRLGRPTATWATGGARRQQHPRRCPRLARPGFTVAASGAARHHGGGARGPARLLWCFAVAATLLTRQRPSFGFWRRLVNLCCGALAAPWWRVLTTVCSDVYQRRHGGVGCGHAEAHQQHHGAGAGDVSHLFSSR